MHLLQTMLQHRSIDLKEFRVDDHLIVRTNPHEVAVVGSVENGDPVGSQWDCSACKIHHAAYDRNLVRLVRTIRWSSTRSSGGRWTDAEPSFARDSSAVTRLLDVGCPSRQGPIRGHGIQSSGVRVRRLGEVVRLVTCWPREEDDWSQVGGCVFGEDNPDISKLFQCDLTPWR